MFQPFRLIVNLVPRVVEEIMEETLQQAVMAKNFQSAPLSGRRQTHAAMFFVFHKRRLLRRELLQHSGYGGGADAEVLRERIAGDPLLFSAAELQDGFQIIIYGFRGVRSMYSRWH